MPLTAVPNTPAIVLQPTGPGGSVSLNPVYSQTDPANGNYFTTTNRDLVTFYAYPASSAAAWLSTTTYAAGQVVNVTSGSPATTTSYIALAYSISGVPQTNLNQPPASSPNFW